MLGILEPMCQLEEVLEIGATPDKDESRHMVYRHHREAAAALLAADAAAEAASTAAVAATAAASADADAAADPCVSLDYPYYTLY
jgi:hypothetical protein